VPEVAPPMRSGATMETAGELSLNAPRVASLGEASVTDDSQGLELPGVALTAAGRLNVTNGLDIGLAYEHGTDTRSRKLAPDQPDVDGGDTFGYGVDGMWSRRVPETRVSVAVTGEFLFYSIPYVEQLTCADELCTPGETKTVRDRVTVPVVSLGVIPSLQLGRVRLFAGLSTRNQPTVPRGGTDDFSGDSQVDVGDLVWTVSGGAEVDFGGVRALAMVYQPLGGEDAVIDYPASFALGVTWAFGKPKVNVATGGPDGPGQDERRTSDAVVSTDAAGQAQP
jgi:hypothetical protein